MCEALLLKVLIQGLSGEHRYGIDGSFDCKIGCTSSLRLQLRSSLPQDIIRLLANI